MDNSHPVVVRISVRLRLRVSSEMISTPCCSATETKPETIRAFGVVNRKVVSARNSTSTHSDDNFTNFSNRVVKSVYRQWHGICRFDVYLMTLEMGIVMRLGAAVRLLTT